MYLTLSYKQFLQFLDYFHWSLPANKLTDTAYLKILINIWSVLTVTKMEILELKCTLYCRNPVAILLFNAQKADSKLMYIYFYRKSRREDERKH